MTEWVPQTFFVVAFKLTENEQVDANEAVWTISTDPTTPGWNTDLGYGGYGMVKTMADFLAEAANEKLQHIIQGDDH